MDGRSGPGRPGTSPTEFEPRVQVADELDFHERLLRDGAPAARVRVVAARALSYGVRVPSEAPYLLRARAERIPTAARGGGGTGLLHLDGDLLWALVLPREHPLAGRDFVRAYGRLGEAVVATLADEGVRARWVPPPGLSDDCCPLSSSGEVLAAGDQVVGGAAQHLSARTLLHHGAVSLRVDRSTVDRLFGLAEGGPSTRLSGLEEMGLRTPPEELARRLQAQLLGRLGV